MAYTYQADVWCDKCGGHIREELTAKGKAPANPEDEYSYDSDDYPKWYDAETSESDGPENCASGNCAGKYGTFLENPLTQYGYAYLKEMLDKHGISTLENLPDYAQEWAEFYEFEYIANEWATAHEWLASKSDDTYLITVLDKLDGDTIQDLFQDEMEEDGFFRESGWYSREMVAA